ncbi:MAG: helix-turn-helix transcriptional regulator [Caulobacteraceae bacterium]|nr:helix-turn-helix transcriptional regulator [Caulobacteraceae bacterium]
MGGRALLAWNLRRLRTARGVSQEKLAVDAGVARSWVSRIERQSANTSIDLVERLAAALEVPMGEFLVAPPEGAYPPEPLRSGRKSGGR